ncbi:uncharacterized protein LOC131607855 [Vicia villosa]|uniref:uncharacterized protein LOC131607855 n=1 Tax=Vicia villosa TaxID=3911 RepID=UPI00273B9845|nr:uncharacterized protein LOC131607855 [Vicia villosa]
MVFNTHVAVRVARFSAEAWQRLSCIDDPINSDQLLDLLCCFPLHQFGRLALCLCSFFCLPQPHSFYSSYLISDSEDEDEDSGSGSSSSTLHLEHDYYYHSHSD